MFVRFGHGGLWLEYFVWELVADYDGPLRWLFGLQPFSRQGEKVDPEKSSKEYSVLGASQET
ncbi:hypothetical protein RRF57_005855 [Xylaria bambusicola]|uniref:Uncharacterized protein n=1 Tax=Xylaria bambusicola TaxID=326684 RepID=A0AAN7YY48_9PEZI